LIVHSEDQSVPTETTDIYQNKFAAEAYLAEGFVHAFRDPANPQDGIAQHYAVIANWLSKES